MGINSDQIRCFIAVPLPKEVQTYLSQLQNHFKTLNLHARWVSPENIHLTLKFLGDIETASITQIRKNLTSTIKSFKQFEVLLGESGVFPNYSRPRVFWVGLRDPEDHLRQINQSIENALQELGFPKEKKQFSPHLTIARIKSTKKIDRFLEEVKIFKPTPLKAFEISKINLYRSQLTPQGSIYTVLEKFCLEE